MKTARVLLCFALFLIIGFAALAAPSGKIRVLVVTGGHDFEREPFFKLFKDNPDITYQAVEHPNAQALFSTESARNWDVLVLYDMHQPISEQTKTDFKARLKDGKGLVVLHHAIANYQDWAEYAKIIGAKYYLEPTTVDGVKKERSLWQHNVEIPVKIADTSHPVTAGLKDFTIHDETYKLFDVFGDVQPLLRTEHPLSNELIGWARNQENARVVYLQLGHDHFAYENPNYIRLLRQAIQWTAKRSGT